LEIFLFLFNEVKKDYYETLGIGKTAAEPEIKRAYFGLVRKYQPDRFPEEFREIRAAYETLSDRQKRAEYDAIGELPSSVAPLFHEAQRLDRFGRHNKAAELYRIILQSHPELDNVREEYAFSLSADDKTGKAAEAWEDLCRRHRQNRQGREAFAGNHPSDPRRRPDGQEQWSAGIARNTRLCSGQQPGGALPRFERNGGFTSG
jgi:curved DNA-binding protein CbpA